MKKFLFTLLIALVFSPLCTSCCRSRCEMWEDTKTCGRYMEKGIRSLFGHHEDPREYVAYLESYDDDNEYIALTDEKPYQQLEMSDYVPPAKESPGDPGAILPGIDGFFTPNDALFSNIHFDTDNYSVNGNENIGTLSEIAQYLTIHPSTYIFVEGHADERGAAAYNLALGSRRANAVRSFLVKNGANPDQVFTISYGKERPLALGHNNASWKQNRRAQFKIYDK